MKVIVLLWIVVRLSTSIAVQLSWDSSTKLVVGATKNVTVSLSEPLKDNAFLFLNVSYQHPKSRGKIPVKYPSEVELFKNKTSTDVSITGILVGQAVIVVNASHPAISLPESPRFRVYVIHSKALDIAIIVVGWIYFVAWSISFYPQVVLNFRRKSVVGLNFDYLAYNITGFVAYGLFNIGLFWIPLVKKQYLQKFPDGVNPVQANDVFFTLHAILLTAITIGQCCIYERGGQRVSRVATALLSLGWLTVFILLFVTIGNKITWLDYLMAFSYLKLAVTLIKYIPQAYMNFRRKSTEGWSIGNVLLDFTGGSLSILQMFLQSYNNEEWDLVFGDPTKFGLGLFSVLFDILFMVQHYILYRKPKAIVESGLLAHEDEE